MKITPAYPAFVLLATTGDGFTAPRSTDLSRAARTGSPPSPHAAPFIGRAPTRLHAADNRFGNPDDGDMSGYLGPRPGPEDGLAFNDIMRDDMASLASRLERGFDPDTRFFGGNTLLHLIAITVGHQRRGEGNLRAIVRRVMECGGDLDARNDMGSTALDFLEARQGSALADDLRRAQRATLRAPVQQDRLNRQLATFSMQAHPSGRGKARIVELVKSGADPDHRTSNGKTVFENVRAHWPAASAEAFTLVVEAARLQSAANGKDKTPARADINDRWINAVMAFYKADAR